MSRLRRPRTGGIVASLALLLWATPLLSPASAVASTRDRWPSLRYASELVHADSLWRGGRGGTRAHAYLDSLIAASRARGDTGLEMVASLRNAAIRGFIEGAFDSAVAQSRRWLGPIRASGDTLSWCVALRTIGYACLARDQFNASLVSYRQMLPLAQRARLPSMEGYARIGLSYIAIHQGRLGDAERGYRIAILKLKTHDAWAARTARAGLANALYSQSKAEPARQEYERVVAEARAAGDPYNEADALNDLGAIEFRFGDPSRAMPLYRAAAGRQRALGRQLHALRSMVNVSQCLAALNRRDDQVVLTDSIGHAAEAIGSYDILVECLTQIATVQRGQGRLSDAEATLLRAVHFQDSASVATRVDAATELVRIQTVAGRPDIAVQTARNALESLGPRADLGALLQALGAAELARGNSAGAVAALRQCVDLVRGLGGLTEATGISYETSLAGALALSGQRDSALVHFRQAARRWEQLRAAPDDLAWREVFDGAGADLYGPFAAALLDPARGGTAAARAAEAFSALQTFRSRTLEDALRGAEAQRVVPRVTLAELQSMLRPGEAVLDVFAAPDTTFLFAVTRDAIRVGTAAGGTQLVPRLRRFRDALASAGDDAALLTTAAASVGEDLLGPVADVLRRSTTLLVSAGHLAEFPLGMLRLPGESGPIESLHRLAIIPSATVLAGARRARARAVPPTGLVALCRTVDSEGVRLEGVAGESRWLARRFSGARVRANEGTQSLEAMLGEVGSGDVLHIASHTRGSAASPWRAGFLLGRGAGEEAYLTAARITQLRPSARVCVLASCASAGASTSAEGLPNLASAWLQAGVRTVIATLWKVDDRATARFVRDLYEALARGQMAGEALAEAQRAARASAERSSPRDWGGFVLVGDPTTRVSLGPASSRAAATSSAGAKRGPQR